jgi:hypothetical protein
MEPNKHALAWIALIFLTLAVLIFIASSGTSSDKEPDDISACVAAREFVRRELKAPATAEFPSCSAMSITHKTNSNKWTVQSHVDAQNSFGAMLRSNFLAEMEYQPAQKSWLPINVVILDP